MNSSEGMIVKIRTFYGLDSPRVFSAMRQVPREKFVPSGFEVAAYKDRPVNIGYGQTISQPYTVCFMTHLLGLKGQEKVLEIGTGSGYQAAILSVLAKKVYTIEIIPPLATKAKKILKELGHKNVYVKTGQGEKGWKSKAPFDAIIVTAGIEGEVPRALFDQLKPGGVLVAPIGTGYDKVMTKYKKTKKGIKKSEYSIFNFVPFIEK